MEQIGRLNLWGNKSPLVFDVQTDFEDISRHLLCIEGVRDFCICEFDIKLQFTFYQEAHSLLRVILLDDIIYGVQAISFSLFLTVEDDYMNHSQVALQTPYREIPPKGSPKPMGCFFTSR